MYKLILSLTISLLFIGCGVVKIEKRQHLKGYHVSSNIFNRANSTSCETEHQQTLNSEKTKTTQVETSEPSEEENSISCTSKLIEDEQSVTFIEFNSSKKTHLNNIQNTLYSFVDNLGLSKDASGTPILIKKSKAEEDQDFSDKRVWLLVLGWIIMAATILAFVILAFTYGELIVYLVLLGIIPAVTMLYFGNLSKSDYYRGKKTNIMALIGFILFFVSLSLLFFEPLIRLAGLSAMVMTMFILIALAQFKKNPDKYKGKWMAYVPIYSITTLFLLVAGFIVIALAAIHL